MQTRRRHPEGGREGLWEGIQRAGKGQGEGLRMAAEGHCPERLARLARRGGNRQRKTVNGKGLGKANP